MSKEIRVPDLPESVADATVGVWHKHAGEFVRAGDLLVEVETDKVVIEVPAPSDGVLGRILLEQGTRVKSAEALATLEPASAGQLAQEAGETADEEEPIED